MSIYKVDLQGCGNVIPTEQVVYYYLEHEAHTSSYNFLWDGVLQGNQVAYDVFGLVSSGIYSASVPAYQFAMATGNKEALQLVCISASSNVQGTFFDMTKGHSS